MYDVCCWDVACHVDSAICHPVELATKDLGNIHFTLSRFFRRSPQQPVILPTVV